MSFIARHRGAFVFLGLLALALAIYLPYALKAGWYYDDWALHTSFKNAGGSWADQYTACTSSFPAGRTLPCLYHVSEFHLFGSHYVLYHLTTIAFLAAMAGLTYAILRQCRMPWQWAALVAALLIVFPSSDTSRLWPVGSVGQYVIVLEMIGVLMVLVALERPRTPARWILHIVASLLFVIAMLTYEIAVPLVALNGIVYWAARRDRPSLVRGCVDLLLAFAFVAYRLMIAPVDSSEDFTVHRTIGEDLSRAWDLTSAAWSTWSETFFAGGAAGAIGVVAVVSLALLLWFWQPEMRDRLLPWLVLLAGCLVIAGAGTFVFLTANDLYIPQTGSTYNRMILPASIPYVGVFVALLGLGYEIVRRFIRARSVAIAAGVIVLVPSVVHQLRISSDHKRAWEASWSEQEIALDGYAIATQRLPNRSRVVGTGAPIWEAGYVPIFAAAWDLGNAIDYTTSFHPSQATPLFPNMACGHRGITFDGALSMPYEVPGEPLYFISSINRSARLVRTQTQCRRAIAHFGRPPLFAPTLRS